MLETTEKLLEADFATRVIRDVDIANLFGGTAARRYGLINKVLKVGELIRLRRGLYVIAPKYSGSPVNEYYLANQIVAHSYITAETALAFYDWIPERVSTFISMVPFGRNKQFTTSFGLFEYRFVKNIPRAKFLYGVQQKIVGQQSVLIASPLRAISDYVYFSRSNDINLDFLQKSLRIEDENLFSINHQEITEVQDVYPQHRMKQFLKKLQKEIADVTSNN